MLDRCASISLALAFTVFTTGPVSAADPVAADPTPTVIAATGTYTHGPSGLLFPEKLDAFTRREIKQMDAKGRDLVLEYIPGDPTARMAASLSLYADDVEGAEPNLEAQSEAVRRRILALEPGAVLAARKPTPLQVGETAVEGQSAIFFLTTDVGGTETKLQSELHVFRFEGWYLEVRVTYPLDDAATGMASSEAFLASLAEGASPTKPAAPEGVTPS